MVCKLEELADKVRRFALPDVPPGWKPDPRRVWGAGKENQPAPPQPQGSMPHEKWRTSGKTADEVSRFMTFLRKLLTAWISAETS